MKLTAVSDNREAFAAAEAIGAGDEARQFADYFHRMHSIDHEALTAASDAWMNTLGRGYVAVVSIEPPGTYHDYHHGTSEEYDSSSAGDFDSYQDYQSHRRNHVKTTETSTWTSGTRIIVRMYVVRIADQKLGWRIYVHGNFTEENSQTTTLDSSDSFGQAIARSLLESMFSGPGGFPAPPNVSESTRQTLKRLAASLPR